MKELVTKLCRIDTKIVIGRDALNILEELEGESVLLHSRKIDPKDITGKLSNLTNIIAIEDGEKIKDVEKVIEILRLIHSNTSPDLEWIIAAGGGTLLDVVGFLASIYKRGIKLVNIPTTFLGMVDAAMGGKNGVNLDGVKNMLGTIYQPCLVISDTTFLNTLSLEEVSNGLAEVIKYSITLDKMLVNLLENKHDSILSLEEDIIEEIIYRSALNKMKIVEMDEWDNKGIRIVLNYGHTIGHAIETATKFNISHGKAVAIGMIYEAQLAQKLGMIGKDEVEYLAKLLRLYRLPTSIKEVDVNIDIDIAVKALRRDKKRKKGFIMLPLLTGIGSWRAVEMDLEDLEAYLKSCLK